MHALAVGVVALFAAMGCAQPSAKQDEARPELSAELTSLVLSEAPSDLPNPLFIDFGGKVALLGYALEPASLAAPGSKVSLKLFWRSSSKLAEGYKLYTELVTAGGKRFEVEGGGALRQGLPPAHWEPGKIYIDEVTLTVPQEMEAARFSIVVGLKTDPIAPDAEVAEKAQKKGEKDEKPATFGAVHLPVLSGPADAKHGGVIATLETGVTPGAKRARAAKDEKRTAGALKRPLPPGKIPVSAKPRPVPAASAR
jgi:hypothetical protein